MASINGSMKEDGELDMGGVKSKSSEISKGDSAVGQVKDAEGLHQDRDDEPEITYTEEVAQDQAIESRE